MKRRIQSYLTVLLSLLLAFALVACNNTTPTTTTTATEATAGCITHRWYDANCTSPKTCLVCGETEGTADADAHAYIMGEETYVCIFCGKDAPEIDKDCEHVKGEDTCPVCGETALNVIKNVIYIIGDGMGLEHIAAGQMAYNKDYAFEEWQFASVNTDSLTSGGRNQSELTDSAVAGTALATGVVTLNGYVGKDQNETDLFTVLDYAKSLNKRTGVLTTDHLYGATPAAFSAHSNNRNNYDEILASQIKSNIDFLCGQFSETNALTSDIITQNGYTHCNSLSEMKLQADTADKLYCTPDTEGFSKTDSPAKLCDLATTAMDFLDNEAGFVLMIEQAHIDKESHNNDFLKMVAAVNSLNDTVDAILAWVGDRNDTAIIVTADHETGDLSVSDSKTLPYAATVEGYPTVYYRFNSGSHTKSNVGFFLYGADIEIERYSYFNTSYNIKNSDIYNIVCKLIRNMR